MTKKFDTLLESLLSEMAAEFPKSNLDAVAAELERLHSSGESTLYPKPLVDIKDPEQRRQALNSIIDKLFTLEDEKFINVDATSKNELQNMLKGAVESASQGEGTKFPKRVIGIAAERLGKWLGTNIKAVFTGSGEVTQKEMQQALNSRLNKEVQKSEEGEQETEEVVADEAPVEKEVEKEISVAPFSKFRKYVFKPIDEIPSGSLSVEQKRVYDEVDQGDEYEGKDLLDYLQSQLRFTSSESQNRQKLEGILNSLLRRGFLELIKDADSDSDEALEGGEEDLDRIARDRAERLERSFGQGGVKTPVYNPED